MAVSVGLLLMTAVLLFVLKYHQAFLKWLKRRLHQYELMAKIKGPHSLPLIGTAYQFKFGRVEFADQLMHWAQHFGPMQGMMGLWLGPQPAIGLLSPEGAEAVLSSSVEIEKSDDYDILVPWLGYGLLISGGTKWRSRRKMLTPTFHYSILDAFVEVYNKQADTFVKVLGEVADTKQTFDMFPYVKRCALDIICETAMGTTVDAQVDQNSEYVMAVGDINEIAFRYQRSPWLWVKPIFYALGYGYRYDECLRVLKGFTSKVMSERTAQLHNLAKQQNTTLAKLNTEGKKTAFLDLLLMMSEENKLTKEDISDEVETFMFEGHDTTASGMSWALFFLGHYPECQDKVFQELSDVFGGDKTRAFTPEDLKKMRYLDMVIKEALRMCPPVPMFARTLKNDLKAGEHTLPAGATAIVISMGIHRSAQVYDDPDTFDPDRFLPENCAKRHPYAYVPFSAGSRNCIGQKFATMEEKTVLAKVLLNYRIESMESMEKARPLCEIITRPPDGFKLRLYRRQ